MPLIDLKTNLKSLKYGKDRINDGSSGQPYITTDPDGNTGLSLGTGNVVGDVLRLLGVNKVPLIPNVSSELNRTKAGRFVNQFLSSDDFIRGGAIGSAQAAVNDTFRIGAFLTSLPRGPIFIAKQVGLQLSNPKLENDKSFTGGFLGIAKLVTKLTGGIMQPTRLYNLGINTLAQVPANAFGIHFNRHGLSPVQDDSTKYESVVTSNNQGDSSNNRLVGLKNKFSLGDFKFEATDSYDLAKKRIDDQNKAIRKIYRNQKKDYRKNVRAVNDLNKANANMAANGVGLYGAAGAPPPPPIPKPTKPPKPKYVKFKPADLAIDTYTGGPGSTYGIGWTLLKRYSFTEDQNKNDDARINGETYAGKSRVDGNVIDYTEGLGTDPNNSIQYYPGLPTTDKAVLSTALAQGINQTYTDLVTKLAFTTNDSQLIPNTGKYSYINGATTYNSAITTVSASVLRDAPDFKYYGNAKFPAEYTGSKATYDNSDVFRRDDAGIMSVLFRAVNPFGQPTPDPANNKNTNEQRWIFNAYMSGYKDNFDATWNDINYAGRSESFYIYNKFKRTVNFNLKIPCFNKIQLFEKHRALGQLASVTAGSYGNNMSKKDGVLLGGVLIKVNLGNYLVGEYAILNNISYSIPDDASWDIADDALLSMYLDASFSLTIVHKDLPQYQQADGTSGFFGYLPDLAKPSAAASGFITPTQIVSKFTKN
jgi:hypothetical protein